jgi:hypothetical protein
MPSSARSRVAAFAAARRARMREVRQPSARANRTDRKSTVPGVPSESANARVAANATTLPEDTTPPTPPPRVRCAVSSATFAETAHAPATRLCAGPAGPSASTRSASSSEEIPSAARADPRGARSPMNPNPSDVGRDANEPSPDTLEEVRRVHARRDRHRDSTRDRRGHEQDAPHAAHRARASQWRTSRFGVRCRTPPRRQLFLFSEPNCRSQKLEHATDSYSRFTFITFFCD